MFSPLLFTNVVKNNDDVGRWERRDASGNMFVQFDASLTTSTTSTLQLYVCVHLFCLHADAAVCVFECIWPIIASGKFTPNSQTVSDPLTFVLMGFDLQLLHRFPLSLFPFPQSSFFLSVCVCVCVWVWDTLAVVMLIKKKYGFSHLK